MLNLAKHGESWKATCSINTVVRWLPQQVVRQPSSEQARWSVQLTLRQL